MIGYKVVERRNKKLESVGVLVGFGGGVRYVKNRETKPIRGCGPLAVFRSLRDAMDFWGTTDREWTVYRCHYTPSRKRAVWNRWNRLFPIKLFWLPPGTRLATSVTLLERVK